MKILVIGGNGLIGSNILLSFHEFSKNKNQLFTLIRSKSKNFFNDTQIECLITEDFFEDLECLINYVKPELILNCVGIVKQKFNIFKKAEIIKWNSIFPNYISDICEKKKIKFINISTDCIFDITSGNNDEDSIKFANDLYSLSKKLGEVKSVYSKTIRLSSIGFEHGLHKHGLLEWFISQKSDVIGFGNAIYSGVSGSETYKIVEWFYNNWSVADLIHFQGFQISKYDLLVLIKELFHININIVKSNEPYIQRNLITKFDSKNQINLPPWNEQISNLIKLKKYYEI